MMRILVVHYSQTGQLTNILNSLLSPFLDNPEFEIEFSMIIPKKPYPFPWSGFGFFDVFPESVLGKAIEIEPVSVSYDDYDLVILGYQVWFLSPSLPFISFLQTDQARQILTGKNVITVIGARNMWVMAHEKIKKILQNFNSNLKGNIVLIDKAGNFTSMVTIVRWLIWGRKNKFLKIFPPAGVSNEDIHSAKNFGNVIQNSLQRDDLNNLQNKLKDAGAVQIIPHLVTLEKAGTRVFKIWAKLIISRGPSGTKSRNIILRIFMVYLPVAIALIAPVITLISKIKSGLMPEKTKKTIEYFSAVE